VKGDGEIMEEIVSKERHKQINKVDIAVHYLLKHLSFEQFLFT